MKGKIRYLLLVLCTTILFLGCKTETYNPNNTSETSIESTTEASSIEINTEDEGNSECIIVSDIVYGSGIVDFKGSNELEPILYIDNSVPLTRSVTIMGKNYDLLYDETIEHPTLDTTIHVYTVYGEKEFYSSISFDAETDKIVKYCLRYDAVPTSEQECINLLMSIIGENYNLSGYEYLFKTNYWYYGENYSETKYKEYFYICGDNEKWRNYSIEYTRDICDIETTEYIIAFFREHSFVIDVYDLGYTFDMFEESLKHIDKLEESISESLNVHIKEVFVVNDFTIEKKTMFLRNGITNIVSDVVVTVADTDNNDTYDVSMQVLTKFMPE